MQGEKSIYDKPIYQVLQYLYSIVLSNIYFLLSNILLLVYSIMVMIEPEAFSVFIFMLLLIPSGPSITALCSTMGKLIREGECNITKEYLYSYKSNFKQSIVLASIFIVGMFVCLLDYKFFINRGSLLGVVFIVIAVYILITSLYAFPIISKIEVKRKQLFALAFYYSIKKLPITLIKIVLLSIGFLISSSVNIISVTFLFSLIGYIIMLCDNKMILELEENLKINK